MDARDRGGHGPSEQPNIFVSYLRVTQHMSQQFRSHFGRLDLTFPQALVLPVLGADGPVPISALAERTGSANSTVSGLVDRLEKLGPARRQRSAPLLPNRKRHRMNRWFWHWLLQTVRSCMPALMHGWTP